MTQDLAAKTPTSAAVLAGCLLPRARCRSIRCMAHHITKQVHDKFKIFSGELAADGTIGKLADQVAAFARKSKIAPKSIGVAYLEHGNRLVITLGYLQDDAPYPLRPHNRWSHPASFEAGRKTAPPCATFPADVAPGRQATRLCRRFRHSRD